MQRLRLGCRVGAELGSEPITQLGVRHQCARRLTSASMSAHERPAGSLVKRIRRDRRLGSRSGQLMFTGGQRRLGQQVPRASDQVGQLAPGRLGPLRVRLVVQDGLRSNRVARPGRRGEGERALAGDQPAFRLGQPPRGIVEVDVDVHS